MVQRKLKTTGFNYQEEALERLLKHDQYGLFLEQGLGKSWIIIARIVAQSAADGLKKVCIVCPKTTIQSVWEVEFEKHSHIKPLILTGDKKKMGARIKASKNKVTVLSYDSVYALRDYWRYFDFDMVVLDESTRIKNFFTRTFKSVDGAFRGARYRYILSGLPAPESPVDLFSQFLWLDGGKTFGNNWYRFRERYMEHVDLYKWEPNLDVVGELNEYASRLSMRIVKKDWIDLPKRTYITEVIPMSRFQNKVYRRMERDFALRINEDYIEYQWIFQQVIKLRQITSGFIYTSNGTKVFKTNPKLNVLKELIKEIRGPIIILCSFIAEIDIIKRFLNREKIKYAIIFGKTNVEDRAKINARFQAGKFKILLAEITTVMYGLTLDRSNHIVFFSNTYSHTKRAQAEERISRVLSTKPPIFIDLVCEKTIDEDVLRALTHKKKLKEVILERYKKKRRVKK